MARFEIAGDFGDRVVIAQEDDGANVVVQEFDVRVKTEAVPRDDPAGASVRAHGKIAYSRLDRWEMERRYPEGRAVLEESDGSRVPILFDGNIIRLSYPEVEMQIWMAHSHREYQVLLDGVSALFAVVSYSYYAIGKREFNLIKAVDLPEQLERRAMQALLIAKLVVGD